MPLPSSSAELALVVIDDATSCLDFPLPRQLVCHPCCWYLEDTRRKKERAPCAQPWKRRPAKKIICYKDPLEWLNDKRLVALDNSRQRSRAVPETVASADGVGPSSTSCDTTNVLDEPTFRLLSGLQTGDCVVTIAANDDDFRLKKVATSMRSSAATGIGLVGEDVSNTHLSSFTTEAADTSLPMGAVDAAVEPALRVATPSIYVCYEETEGGLAGAAVEPAQGEVLLCSEELDEAREKAISDPSDKTTSECSHSPMMVPPPSRLKFHGFASTATTAPRPSDACHDPRLESPSSTQWQGLSVCLPAGSHVSQPFRAAKSLPLKKRKVWMARAPTRSPPSHDHVLLSKPPPPSHADSCITTASPSVIAASSFVPIERTERLRTSPKTKTPPQQTDTGPTSHQSIRTQYDHSNESPLPRHRELARPEPREQHSSGVPSGAVQQRIEAKSHSQSTTIREFPATTHAGRVTKGALSRDDLDSYVVVRNSRLSRNLHPLQHSTDRSSVQASLELELSSKKRRAPQDDDAAGALVSRDRLPIGSPLATSRNTTPCLLAVNPHPDECAMGSSASGIHRSHLGMGMWEQVNFSQHHTRATELHYEEDDDKGKNGGLLTETPITCPFEPIRSYSPLRRSAFKRARPPDGPIHAFSSSSNVILPQASPTEVPPNEGLPVINPIDTRPSASSACGSISPLERVLHDNSTCYEVPAPKFPTASASASKQEIPRAASIPRPIGNSSPDSSTGDPVRTWKEYLKDWVKW